MRYSLLFVCICACSAPQRLTRAASAVYVRTDSDRTTIVTPKVDVAADVAAHTNVAVGYEIDAWTGASVDVVTAATPAIHELRHEVEVSATQELAALRLRAGYRHSTEPDYRSHGLVLGGQLELAHKNTTLGLDVLASDDAVGRAGDPSFDRPLRSLGARLALAQVIDRATLADVALESTVLDGYQASPYRWVAVGGDGTCGGAAPFCVPEHVPERRYRTSVFGRLRRAIARDVAVGLEYRFYFDDWGVRSHAVQPDVAWRVVEHGVLALRYRYYTQGEASFYRPRYFDVMGSGDLTRDRKLSALFSHELGASYLHRFELQDGARVLTAGLRSSLSRLDYLAFVGLDHVYALELTALVGIELP